MTNLDYVLSLVKDECDSARQKGFTEKHDLEHKNGELAQASAYYALPAEARAAIDTLIYSNGNLPMLWPFEYQSFKPRPEYRFAELLKSAQFIMAELVRLYSLRHEHLTDEGKNAGMTFEDWKREYIAAGIADGISREEMETNADWEQLRETYEFNWGAVEAYKEANYE